MGCDIHAYVEEKMGDNWQMVSHVTGTCGERDYDFFTHLCGVRAPFDSDDVWPESKGMPNDSSIVVKEFSRRWHCDGHSHSCEPAQEFMEKKLVLMRLRNSEETPTGTSISWQAWKLLGYSIDIDEGENLDNFRVVFWFDN